MLRRAVILPRGSVSQECCYTLLKVFELWQASNHKHPYTSISSSRLCSEPEHTEFGFAAKPPRRGKG